MKLRLGGLVPADCVGRLETSEVTGESLLVTMRKGDKPNNVWSGLKHSRRALTLKFVMLSVRSLCLVQLRGTVARQWSCVARTN